MKPIQTPTEGQATPTPASTSPAIEDHAAATLDNFATLDRYTQYQIAPLLEGYKNIKAARTAYLDNPSDEAKQLYIKAIQDQFTIEQSMYDSNGPLHGYRYTPSTFKGDGILSGRELAMINGPAQAAAASKENQAKPKPRSLDADIAASSKLIAGSVPKILESDLRTLNGSWVQRDPSVYVNRLIDAALRSSYGYINIDSVEGAFRAKMAIKSALVRYAAGGSNKKARVFAELVNKDNGDVIRMFGSPRSDNKLAGTMADAKLTSDALAKIHETTNVTKPLQMSVVAPGTILPDGSTSDNSRALGYAFPGGGGHVLPDRLQKMIANGNHSGEEYNPDTSWHSVPQNNYQEAFTHTVVHEMGHVLMYKYWGEDMPMRRGDQNLKKDYEQLGIDKQKISRYGTKNHMEHFAEAYARYVLTGDATPEFRDLLGSKGLLKSQKKD